ncbi:MAG: hypothetical protein IJQ16_10460 [Selenomonadaceae bacterium]|nr:hypothetical protein [Selenomonadaceae bacterium]
MKYFSDEGFIKIDEKQVGAPEDKVADLLNVSVDELRNVSRKVGISNSKGGIYDIDGKYYYSSHEVIFKVRNENGKKSADLSTNELIKIFQKAESRLLSADVVKKKRTKENIIGGILIVAIIFGIGSCFFGGDDKKNTNQPTQKVETPMPVGEEAEKAEIVNIIKNSTKNANFRDATITKIYNADRYNLVVFLNGHDNLTTNMVYSGYKFAVRDILKGLYTSRMGNKINDVKISIYTKMINQQTGAKSEDVIYMLAMTRERANQMHWENIEQIDIENAATERFMHPALQRELNKN